MMGKVAGASYRAIIILFLFVSFFSGKVAGQHFLTHTYTEADGLANSMIHDIIQDTSGMMWMARRSGLSSYDGLAFKNYNITDGISTTTFAFFSLDETGGLYALPYNGSLVVYHYTGEKWVEYSSYSGLPQKYSVIYSGFEVIRHLDDVVITVGTKKSGLFQCKGGKWRHFGVADGLPDDVILSIRTFNNEVLISTGKGMSVLKANGEIQPVLFTGNPLPSPVLCLSKPFVNNGRTCMYLMGDHWLALLTQKHVTILTNAFQLPRKRIEERCFLNRNGTGKVYFGNSYKVFSYDEESKQVVQLTRNDGLISEGASSVWIDREFNTWICGYRGITKIPPVRFSSYSANDGMAHSEVASALETEPGQYVFGHNGVLSFFDGQQFTTLVLDPSILNGIFESRVQDLAIDKQGNIWVAASTLGIARVDKNRQVRWFGKKEGIYGMAGSVFVDAKGIIYAGTNQGLFLYHEGIFVKKKVHPDKMLGIRKIFSDARDDLYLATYLVGIIRWSDEAYNVISNQEEPLSNKVYSFFEDKNHQKWVGTAGGLYLIQGDSLVRPPLGFFTIERPIYSILQDVTGRFWFGTDNGIFSFDGKTTQHFTTKDGLSGLEINRSACFEDTQHHIWFGTNNGISVYDTHNDKLLNKIPPPRISLLMMIGEKDTLNPIASHAFSHNNNSITFFFRVLSFLDEKQIEYAYYLEGMDTGWSAPITYKQYQLSFPNLKPGKYRLHIKAGNNLNTWSGEVVSGYFKIKYPIWQRWWFVLLVIIGGLGLFYFIGRYWVAHQTNKQLEEQVAKRTAALLASEKLLLESNASKDTFFSVLAHDLRSPFTGLLGMLEVLTLRFDEFTDAQKLSLLKKLRQSADQTFQLLEKILTWAWSQKGLMPVTFEDIDLNDIVSENVEQAFSFAYGKNVLILFEEKEKCRVRCDWNMISAVVRNLLSNAIKFSYPEGIITVTTSSAGDGFIVLEVRDQGIGMSIEARQKLFSLSDRVSTKGTEQEAGSGLGLILTKDFVDKNKGKLEVESELGKGTTFKVFLPAAFT